MMVTTFSVNMKNCVRKWGTPQFALFVEPYCVQTMWLRWAVSESPHMAERVPCPQRRLPLMMLALKPDCPPLGVASRKSQEGRGDKGEDRGRPSEPLAPGSSSRKCLCPAGPGLGRGCCAKPGEPPGLSLRSGVATCVLCRVKKDRKLRPSCCRARGSEEGSRREN